MSYKITSSLKIPVKYGSYIIIVVEFFPKIYSLGPQNTNEILKAMAEGNVPITVLVIHNYTEKVL